jgi:hypothetical protein
MLSRAILFLIGGAAGAWALQAAAPAASLEGRR